MSMKFFWIQLRWDVCSVCRLLLCKWGALQYFRLCFPADVSTSREASVRERPSPPPITSGRRGLLLLPSSPRAWECQLLCNSVLHTHCMLVILLHTCMHINVESTQGSFYETRFTSFKMFFSPIFHEEDIFGPATTHIWMIQWTANI